MTMLPLAAVLVATVAHAADFDHVLLVVLDDVGTDKLSSYAGDVDNPSESRPETPTLDLIGAAGVRFTDAWATPLCSPTRGMLYTGEYPYRTGGGHAIQPSSPPFHPDTDTLMELAGDAGLRTGLFGKWHLGETDDTPERPSVNRDHAEYPVVLGFQAFAGNMGGGIEEYDRWLYLTSEPSRRGSSTYTTIADLTTRNATTVTIEDAQDWMGRDATTRRLTVVGFNLAHNTRARTAGRWDDGAEVCGSAIGTDLENKNAMVECLDDAVLALLEGTPDLEDTLVVVLGDNGTEAEVTEGNFDDGRGKGTVYESGVRVPFLVADGAALALALDTGGAFPPAASFRIEPGQVVSEPTSVVDVFATVADYLDLSSASCVPGSTCGRDSVSLRPLLEGGTPARDDVWTETWVYRLGSYVGRAAVRRGDLKLIVDTQLGSGCRTYELYDLVADRWETTSLWDDASVAAEQAVLEGILADHEAAMEYAWLPTPLCTP